MFALYLLPLESIQTTSSTHQHEAQYVGLRTMSFILLFNLPHYRKTNYARLAFLRKNLKLRGTFQMAYQIAHSAQKHLF